MVKKTQDGGAQSIVQNVLVLLLIVAAFFIGYLWNKVQTMESAGGGTNNAPTANAPTAPAPAVSIDSLVSKLDLNKKDFDECLSSGYGKAEVEADVKTGTTAGVRGTPASFLIDSQTGKIARVPGALPLEQLTPVIDSMLDGTYEETEDGITVAEVTSADHLRGSQDARITMVEYSDYDCPFCKRFHPTAQSIVSQYSGQVSWVLRHFPLDSLHPNARAKAEAAECVAKISGNDAFWNFSDMLAE